MTKNEFEQQLQLLQLKQFEYMTRESKAKAEAAESIAEREKYITDAVRREQIKQGLHLSPV